MNWIMIMKHFAPTGYRKADPVRPRGAIAVYITIGLSISSILGGCYDG